MRLLKNFFFSWNRSNILHNARIHFKKAFATERTSFNHDEQNFKIIKNKNKTGKF